MNSENLPAVIESSAKAQGLVLSGVNLIMPTETYGAVLGQFDKVTIETVRVNARDAREAYEPNGTGKGFALTKSSLQAIASALLIQWHPQYTGIVESTATRSRAKAVGIMRKPNGEMITQTEEKTIDLDVERDNELAKATKNAEGGKVDHWESNRPVKVPWKSDAERDRWIELEIENSIKQKRRFKDELALTGAKDRVIRAFLALKSTYTAEELSKPLAFPRVSLDTSKMLDDPRMRASAIGMIGQSAESLYGKPAEASAAPAQAPERTVDAEPTAPPPAPASEDLDFGAPPADMAPEADQVEAARAAIRDYCSSGVLSSTQINIVLAAADNPATPLEGDGGLLYYLDLCKRQEVARGGKRAAS